MPSVDPPAPTETLPHVPTWANLRLWPGWERGTFLAWCGTQGITYHADPWALFAEWWKVDGWWRVDWT